jgi:hypothetical protein
MQPGTHSVLPASHLVMQPVHMWHAFAPTSAPDPAITSASVLPRCSCMWHCRCQEARAAEGQQRFSAGYKRDEVLPHTKGLRAYALAALCPQLRHFSMDERASCLGGMTDDMARALAVHCKQLTVLEVYFQRYSLPSEMFTDEGLIALTEGCRGLRRLTLHNCDRVSDRCARALGELGVGGSL